MKFWDKKFLSVFCAFFIFFGSITVKGETLYEKYSYQEQFEYSDVMIGHALKTTVPQIVLIYSATIEYQPVTLNIDLINEQFENLCEEYASEYSEEEIAIALLQDMQENLPNYLDYTSPKKVKTEGSFSGSGVVISEDGYIATNSHVASLNSENKKQIYLYELQEEVAEDLEAVIDEVGEFGITFDDTEILALHSIILEDAATKATILKDDTTLEVWFPNARGDAATDTAIVYPAKTVAEGTQDGIEGLTQDTAILKIDADNLVALPLSDSYPDLNSKLVSAGFPGASDKIFQSMGSSESGLSLTVGTGQVTRLVPVKGSDYQAIGISNAISGGNSGGPSVDSNLHVEGLNTYGLSEDMRYAFMISAEYVNDLAAEFSPHQGETSKTFLTGLQLLQNGYGDSALECFEHVAKNRPDTPHIESLIQYAKTNPGKGSLPANEQNKGTKDEEKKEDNSENAESLDTKTILIIVGSILAALLLTILIISLSIVRKKKRAVDIEMEAMGISRHPSRKKRKRLTDDHIPVMPTTYRTPPTPVAKFPSTPTPSVSTPRPTSPSAAVSRPVPSPSATPRPTPSVTPVVKPTAKPVAPPTIKISGAKNTASPSKPSIKISPSIAEKQHPGTASPKETTPSAFQSASEKDL